MKSVIKAEQIKNMCIDGRNGKNVFSLIIEIKEIESVLCISSTGDSLCDDM